MKEYLIKNKLGMYVLSYCDKDIVITPNRWEALKLFDLKSAEKLIKLLGKDFEVYEL